MKMRELLQCTVVLQSINLPGKDFLKAFKGVPFVRVYCCLSVCLSVCLSEDRSIDVNSLTFKREKFLFSSPHSNNHFFFGFSKSNQQIKPRRYRIGSSYLLVELEQRSRCDRVDTHPTAHIIQRTDNIQTSTTSAKKKYNSE